MNSSHPRVGPVNCAACDATLPGGIIYFCVGCWNLLPGDERAAFSAMYRRRDNLGAKMAKCVRIINARRPVAAVAETVA